MEQNNKITDQSHWDDYWANFRYDRTPTKVAFQQFTKRLTEGESLIEIGGFPGIFTSYFYRHGITDVTLLDFHMNLDIVRTFEKINGLPQNSIQCIESDFFKFIPDRKYDVAFSSGFIEHFNDTRDVIQRHVDLLTEKGQLLILIPNFLGLNGYLQKRYDLKNLQAHNLKAMEIDRLKKMMATFPLREVTITYTGKPMLWLEPKPQNSGKQKWIRLLSYLIKIWPFKGKFFSPFIAIYARK